MLEEERDVKNLKLQYFCIDILVVSKLPLTLKQTYHPITRHSRSET